MYMTRECFRVSRISAFPVGPRRERKRVNFARDLVGKVDMSPKYCLKIGTSSSI